MSSDSSTPTPWFITGQSHRSYEGPEIGTSNKTICVILCANSKPSEAEKADAELIVRSVNCHAPLVAALERLSFAAERGQDNLEEELKLAREALQLVRHAKLADEPAQDTRTGDLF